MIDYLQKVQIINGEYYANLRHLKETSLNEECCVCWCFVDPGHCSCSHSTSGSRRNVKMRLRTLHHRLTLQIWHHMTSYVLLKTILGLRSHNSSEKWSQNLNIGGQSALKFRGTMLKNNIETICLWWCFHVKVENNLNYSR